MKQFNKQYYLYMYHLMNDLTYRDSPIALFYKMLAELY